jgi:hypothetical protein
MIAYCPSLENSPAIVGQENGASDAALESNERVRKALEHYSSSRLELLVPEIMSLVRDIDKNGRDRDQKSVSRDTAIQARRFAELLPKSQPIPEVAADPDGEISFDWFGRSGGMFSVSVDATGRLAYAGRFGEKSKVHGVEQLSSLCPPEVLRGIERTEE